MSDNKYLFTSESVSEGHPDKVCDRISDMVVDSYILKDPVSRVACETLTTTNKVVLAGETRGPKIEKVELFLSNFDVKKIKTGKYIQFILSLKSTKIINKYILNLDNVDGALVGGASLKARDFCKIIDSYN